jgi:hypothetical protein
LKLSGLNLTRKLKTIDAQTMEKVIMIWALVACIGYFVQKAAADYTFDYAFLTTPMYETRFHAVLAQPPAARFGYLTEDFAQLDADTLHNKIPLARYLLAPYITGGNQQYYVGDFHRPVDLGGYARQTGLILIKDYGNGVALFKKGTDG